MSAEGQQLLSKIIDENNVAALDKYGIERGHFVTEGERAAYDSIRNYANTNGGAAPSYATVVAEADEFTYIPQVTDSYTFLVEKIKDGAGKRRISEYFSGNLQPMFENNGAAAFIELLQSDMEKIRIGIRTSVPIGTDVKSAAADFLAEYRARKAGTSFRIWSSKFAAINAAIGGYFSGNMYTWYARSGRGKSVIVMEEALEAAFQGATVLVWTLEMGSYEWMARAFSSISGRFGLVNARIGGIDYDAGFDTKAMLMASLSAEYEDALATFISTLNDTIPGRVILRAVDDPDFRERNLRQLEADIIETKADVVVVDPFYYLEYERNTSRTTGGDAANTSKKLRLIGGRTKAVVHVITQADEDDGEKTDGVRELSPPRRGDVKKTAQLLEDATNLIGIDTLAHEGRGIIKIGKGRNGGEDTQIELLYLPNYGIVREITDGANPAQFTGVF
jgi:replicative DNA helicase